MLLTKENDKMHDLLIILLALLFYFDFQIHRIHKNIVRTFNNINSFKR